MRTTDRPSLKASALVAVIAGLALLATAPAGAEAGNGEPSDATGAVAKGPADELERGVPRSSMLGYLEACREGDYPRAARFLDLRQFPRESREAEGTRLARRLKIVLDKELWVDLETLSDDPVGHAGDSLPSYRDRVGTIQTTKGPVEILLQKVPREDGVSIWKISSATVAAIPRLYGEFGYGPIEAWLPAWMLDVQVLEVSLWQWSALMVVLIGAFLLGWVLVSGVLAVIRPLVRRSRTNIDDRLLDAALSPFRLAATVGFFHTGITVLGLAVPVRRFLVGLEQALLVLAVTWLIFRLIDAFTEIMESRFALRGQGSIIPFVPLGRKTLKAVVGVLAFLAAIDSFGFDITALVAGLGVGGLAVALAAQKTLENVFGGVTIIADQPVRPGDFCRFGDKIGIVEEIGLRSTRVRTLDRTVVTIPNAEFSVLQLENYTRRDQIWYHPRIGLRYETTPDQLRYVLAEVRRMLLAHPKVSPDPARIRFAGFGDFSLDLDIFAYIRTSDYNEFLEVAEDLNLRIMDIVEQAGSGFAFPSSTTYLGKDDGLDEERASAAEAKVRAWRESGQ